MEKKSQSFYETGRGDKNGELLGRGPSASLAEVWARETRRRKRYTALYVLLFAVFGVLIGTVVVQQYLLTTQLKTERTDRPRQPGASVDTRRSHPLDLDIPPQAEMLMAELQEIDPEALPAAGPAPLNTSWIKQAAYYIVMAERAYKNDELENALQYYNRALKVYPDLEGVHRYRGLIYLHLQDYPAAADAFAQAARSETVSQGILNNLGVSFLALDDYAQAKQYFTQAIQMEPNYSLAYLNLATLHARADENQQAANFFREYLERKPDDLRAAQAYADVLMEERQWQRAATVLDQVREKAPELPAVYFQLAVSLGHLGRTEEALIALRRGTVLLDPRKALGWLSRGEFDVLRQDPDFQALVAELSEAEQ